MKLYATTTAIFLVLCALAPTTTNSMHPEELLQMPFFEKLGVLAHIDTITRQDPMNKEYNNLVASLQNKIPDFAVLERLYHLRKGKRKRIDLKDSCRLTDLVTETIEESIAFDDPDICTEIKKDEGEDETFGQSPFHHTRLQKRKFNAPLHLVPLNMLPTMQSAPLYLSSLDEDFEEVKMKKPSASLLKSLHERPQRSPMISTWKNVKKTKRPTPLINESAGTDICVNNFHTIPALQPSAHFSQLNDTDSKCLICPETPTVQKGSMSRHATSRKHQSALIAIFEQYAT